MVEAMIQDCLVAFTHRIGIIIHFDFFNRGFFKTNFKTLRSLFRRKAFLSETG